MDNWLRITGSSRLPAIVGSAGEERFCQACIFRCVHMKEETGRIPELSYLGFFEKADREVRGIDETLQRVLGAAE